MNNRVCELCAPHFNKQTPEEVWDAACSVIERGKYYDGGIGPATYTTMSCFHRMAPQYFGEKWDGLKKLYANNNTLYHVARVPVQRLDPQEIYMWGDVIIVRGKGQITHGEDIVCSLDDGPILIPLVAFLDLPLTTTSPCEVEYFYIPREDRKLLASASLRKQMCKRFVPTEVDVPTEGLNRGVLNLHINE